MNTPGLLRLAPTAGFQQIRRETHKVRLLDLVEVRDTLIVNQNVGEPLLISRFKVKAPATRRAKISNVCKPHLAAFEGSKGGDDWVRTPNGRGWGWRDSDGNVWAPTGHGADVGPHWDKQPAGGRGPYFDVHLGGRR